LVGIGKAIEGQPFIEIENAVTGFVEDANTGSLKLSKYDFIRIITWIGQGYDQDNLPFNKSSNPPG